ncbi:MAG: cytosine permease, partial [Pontimonas sp.]
PVAEELEEAPVDESESEGDAEDEPLDDEESPSAEGDEGFREAPPSVDKLPVSAPTPHLAPSTIGTLGSWWGVAVPIAAILAGGYLSFRGLGILESAVVLGAVVLVTSAMVGVLSHQGFRRGHATQDLLRGSFGKRGALIPAIVVAVIQVGLASALLWWASDVLVDIVGGAGLWPYERWIGAAGSWGLLVGVVAALTLVSSRVLHAALIAGSLASLAALVLLVVLGLPNMESTLDWSWNAGWMTVVSALSVLLSLAVSLTVFVAADLATLGKSVPARAGGVVSALALALPALALAGVASWMAQSSPLVSLGLFADPVGTLTQGAPAYYPSIAAFIAVVPLVAVVSLLTRSASTVVPSIPFPGPWRVHAAVILGVVTVVGSLALVFNLQLIDVLSDLALSVGVVASALAAILAKEWAVVGTTRRPEGSSVRALPLGVLLVSVAVGLGLLDSNVSWLSWQGYLFPALDAAGVMDLSPAQPGVLVSFVLAALVSGIGALVERSRVRKNSDVEVN